MSEQTNDAQFTPGPWEWNDLGGHLMLLSVHHGKLVVLQPARKGMHGACLRMRDAHCIMHEMSPDHPDARLIAAAPMLLDACRSAVRLLERQDAGEWTSLVDDADVRHQLNEAITLAILPGNDAPPRGSGEASY